MGKQQRRPTTFISFLSLWHFFTKNMNSRKSLTRWCRWGWGKNNHKEKNVFWGKRGKTICVAEKKEKHKIEEMFWNFHDIRNFFSVEFSVFISIFWLFTSATFTLASRAHWKTDYNGYSLNFVLDRRTRGLWMKLSLKNKFLIINSQNPE